MKKYFIPLGNSLLIITGLLGLKTPYLSDAIVSVGLGGILDEALLQPLYIVFLVLGVYGQVVKIKDTLSFMPLILELIFGIMGFFYIFPFENQIVGYLCLAVMLFLIFCPMIKKFLKRKKIVTIKV